MAADATFGLDPIQAPEPSGNIPKKGDRGPGRNGSLAFPLFEGRAGAVEPGSWSSTYTADWGAMSAAAYTLPVDRQSDWLAELERILDRWDGMPPGARNAVNTVVESLLSDPESSVADVLLARALLTNHERRRLRPAS